ncbi:MAG TPA: hypothetical protein VN824_02565 [Puia sp.]|nr:hypothetical protein [Puia sp.]
MKSLGRIAVVNILVILAYSALIRLIAWGGSGRGSEAGLGIALMSAFAVGAHVLICLVVAGVYSSDKKRDLGKAWLLSAGVVLLVGFSTCLGNASL